MGALIADMERELQAITAPMRRSMHPQGGAGAVAALKSATQALLRTLRFTPRRGHAGRGVPEVVRLRDGGWLLAKSAAIAAGKAGRSRPRVLCAKIRTARFLRRQVLAGRGGARARGRGRRDERVETDAALI